MPEPKVNVKHRDRRWSNTGYRRCAPQRVWTYPVQLFADLARQPRDILIAEAVRNPPSLRVAKAVNLTLLLRDVSGILQFRLDRLQESMYWLLSNFPANPLGDPRDSRLWPPNPNGHRRPILAAHLNPWEPILRQTCSLQQL